MKRELTKKEKIIIGALIVMLLLLAIPDKAAGPTNLEPITRASHQTRFDGYIVQEGIDVSVFNDSEANPINWRKVADTGIDFAFIRIGGTGYNEDANKYADKRFQYHIKESRKQGLMRGVYYYSQAISVKEAEEEAKYVLELLDGMDLELPVVFDYEYAMEGSYHGGRLYKAELTDRQRTDICLKFCQAIEEAGYDAMVYANKHMLEHDLYADEISEKYQIWLAHYGRYTGYKGEIDYWQYTDKMVLDGINGYVDYNYRYIHPDDASASDKNKGTEVKVTEVWLDKDTFKYDGKVHVPGFNIKDEGLVEGKDYFVYYDNEKSKDEGVYGVTIRFVGEYCGLYKFYYVIEG